MGRVGIVGYMEKPRSGSAALAWQYKHWKGDFYPSDLPQREWLEYYARHFDTVEVNRRVMRRR